MKINFKKDKLGQIRFNTLHDSKKAMILADDYVKCGTSMNELSEDNKISNYKTKQLIELRYPNIKNGDILTINPKIHVNLINN